MTSQKWLTTIHPQMSFHPSGIHTVQRVEELPALLMIALSVKATKNQRKTHLLVMSTDRMHKIHGNFGIVLDTGMETILPQDHEKLLGCTISSNFTWNQHLRDDEFSLHMQLTSRINALRKISFAASFATRKMIANGIVISRIIYVIQIWGGTNEYLLKML